MNPIDPNISYKAALERLEAIVRNLQSDQCDIDSMVAMTREATQLITICRNRLTTTEEELKSVLQDFQ